jgi:hypothetical protein
VQLATTGADRSRQYSQQWSSLVGLWWGNNATPINTFGTTASATEDKLHAAYPTTNMYPCSAGAWAWRLYVHARPYISCFQPQTEPLPWLAICMPHTPPCQRCYSTLHTHAPQPPPSFCTMTLNSICYVHPYRIRIHSKDTDTDTDTIRVHCRSSPTTAGPRPPRSDLATNASA